MNCTYNLEIELIQTSLLGDLKVTALERHIKGIKIYIEVFCKAYEILKLLNIRLRSLLLLILRDNMSSSII